MNGITLLIALPFVLAFIKWVVYPAFHWTPHRRELEEQRMRQSAEGLPFKGRERMRRVS